MATKAAHPDALLLTVEQTAERLGLSRATVFDLIKRNEIASVRVGAARRIIRADLERFVERQLSTTEGAA